ncbi:hypothetical protein MVI01_74080 [Myxococcus virescens]|uniref:Uncharacterized protein n=1 Tax=Myxococcus virescens TaxID=83456 RepID=A0A511HQG8_9BACT|nr:hypothetical protein MVI01_74080 [Myxococcus virescens]
MQYTNEERLVAWGLAGRRLRASSRLSWSLVNSIRSTGSSLEEGIQAVASRAAVVLNEVGVVPLVDAHELEPLSFPAPQSFDER